MNLLGFLPYVIMVLISCLSAYLYDCTVRGAKISFSEFPVKQKLSPIRIGFLVLTILPMLLISGLRNPSVGIDTGTIYQPEFEVSKFNGPHHSDIGFFSLEFIISHLGFNFQFFLIVISAIFLCGFYSLAVLFNDNLLMITSLLILTFNFHASLSLIAQYTAMGVMLFATRELLLGHRSLSLILILLGSTFHISALIFIALWGVYVILTIVRRPVFAAINIGITAVILSFTVGTLIPALIAGTRFWVYTGNEKYASLSSTSMIVINFSVLLFLFYKFVINKELKKTPLMLLFFIIQLIGAVLSLFQDRVILLVRILYYFNIFQCFLLPAVTSSNAPKAIRVIENCLIGLVFFVWFAFYPLSNNYYSVLPYKLS